MKSSISFVCQECGYDSPRWFGKCPECSAWNSFKEISISKSKVSGRKSAVSSQRSEVKPKTLDEIQSEGKQRIATGFSEMDGVLGGPARNASHSDAGGGIVKGSVILLAGDPGIGKSTLLLQVALQISNFGIVPRNVSRSLASRRGKTQNDTQNNTESKLSKTVLYISGEESEEQIKIRAKRIVSSQEETKNLFLLSITDTDAIVSIIEQQKPSLVIIDSIQTMESENMAGLSGSVGQVRYAAQTFIKVAKTLNIPIILVGHVTKEGMVAGPMVLSHMVDTVLFLEGEKLTDTRILRSLKNRFGPIDEVGIFSMDQRGLREVKNPEEIFLTSFEKKTKSVPGSVLVSIMEGTRPFLIEIQALTVFSKLPIPRHVSSGIDNRRLELLLAVLQRHCNLALSSMDVFVNVAGGIKVMDRGVDLGICLAIFSSLKNIALNKTVAIAEVGLLGELRNVSSLDKRIRQAKKLGFDKIISAETNRYLFEVIKQLGK
ncbi:MAG: AAA family ATPase [Patescibacteria group bacterium]